MMFDLRERPKPVQSHVTRWTQDELARGSYSFVANGSGSDMCNTLAQPEWDGRLCFAGEACVALGSAVLLELALRSIASVWLHFPANFGCFF